jgi:hypothetical protein
MQSVATLPFNSLEADAGQGLTIEDFVNEFHADSSGHIHHAYADPTQAIVTNRWIQRACETLGEFGERLSFNHSEYMTFNSSYYKRRIVQFPSKFNKKEIVYNVHELNAFVIDIDLYKSKHDKEMFISSLHAMVKHGLIPQYRFLVNSGNGYYIIFQIERITLSRRKEMSKQVAATLGIYDAIQRYLISLFRDFGVDAQCVDPMHVYGIPGTYNCKNGEKKLRYIMEYHEDAVITMEEFRSEYLPEDVVEPKKKIVREKRRKYKKEVEKKVVPRQNKKKQTRHKSTSTHKRFNTKDKHNLIITDLEKLVQLRKGQAMEGYRSLIAFMSRYSWNLLANDEVAVEKMLYLNSQFKDPIDDMELVEQTKYAVTGAEDFKAGKVTVVPNGTHIVRVGYNYKKESFVDLLDITPEEQKQLNYLVDPALTYKRKKEKNKEKLRDDYGLTKRDKQVLDKFIRVQQLKNEGKTQLEIAELLSIGERTVQRNWTMPCSKNSEHIYSVYSEIMASIEQEPELIDEHVMKHSCYVKREVTSPSFENPLVATSLDPDDGSFDWFARQAEVLTLEDLRYIRDSYDPDDSNFRCLARYWNNILLPDGGSCDVGHGETICIYDKEGIVVWRNPIYFRRIVPMLHG